MHCSRPTRFEALWLERENTLAARFRAGPSAPAAGR